MPFALLLALFVVVPIVELAVIIQVGQELGVLPTIGLLLADSVLGSLLMRSQGRLAWQRLNTAIAAGRPPAKEVLDGGLVVFGGALLLTPGFLTDVLGLLLLLPPTRAVVRRLLVRAGMRRVLASVARPGAGGAGAAGAAKGPWGPPGDVDVEGTAREVDPRRLP